MANKEPNTDDMVKYLGFGIHPGKIEEFWKSDEEKKQYLEGVKARGGEVSILDRDSSLLNVRLMSPVDRAISLFGSFLLIISFLLPVYSFTVQDRYISGNAISYLLNLGFLGSYASTGGFIMILALVIFAAILIANPVVGVLNIMGLLNKNKGYEYLERVKKTNRYYLILLGLYVLLMLVLLIGAPQPFGAAASEALGDSINLSAIFKLTGLGFWLGIAGLAIGFAQSRGI